MGHARSRLEACERRTCAAAAATVAARPQCPGGGIPETSIAGQRHQQGGEWLRLASSVDVQAMHVSVVRASGRCPQLEFRTSCIALLHALACMASSTCHDGVVLLRLWCQFGALRACARVSYTCPKPSNVLIMYTIALVSGRNAVISADHTLQTVFSCASLADLCTCVPLAPGNALAAMTCCELQVFVDVPAASMSMLDSCVFHHNAAVSLPRRFCKS